VLGAAPRKPDEALGQHRAVPATTAHFDTAIEETESFEENLAEVCPAYLASLGDTPLTVSSRGVCDPQPVSDAENQHAWQTWQAMWSELAELRRYSRHVVAEQSGRSDQPQRPQAVVDDILEVVRKAQE
jgi:hypothetical protein